MLWYNKLLVLCLFSFSSYSAASAAASADSRSRFSRSVTSGLTWLARHLSRSSCNSFNPQCNLSASDAQQYHLSSYAQLVHTLKKTKSQSKVPIEVGPLVVNGNNEGLIDIDVSLDQSLAPVVKVDVCGEGKQTSVREAVVCTVSQSTVLRGNVDHSRVGFSNHGRVLWGARLGNRDGKRVFIATQLHGNEPAATEAALQILKTLTRWPRYSRAILEHLDLLFLLRANVDAGEPSGENQPPSNGPFTDSTWGFFRQNIDATAGGGFLEDTETDFYGVVGRGYDLNRYNYAGLNHPIRPVESQAIVAVLHVFRPDILFDIHGDQPKVRCELDSATVVPGAVQGVLPTVKCKKSGNSIPTLLTDRKSMVIAGFFADDASVLSGKQTDSLKSGPKFTENSRLVRSIAADIVSNIERRVTGSFSRFNQIQLEGSETFSDGTLDRAALTLSAVGSGWEVPNFSPVLTPAITSVSLAGGSMKPVIGVDRFRIEPCFLGDNICIHQLILQQALFSTARLIKTRIHGDNGYCSIPLDNGILVSFPESVGWTEKSIETPVLVPHGGEFGVPVSVSGACVGDP